jgi:hypothetical protein
LQNSSNCSIQGNLVEPGDNTANNSIGIALINSDESFVTYNSHYIPNENITGLFAPNSQNATYKYNHYEGFKYGMHFDGMCDNSTLKCNYFWGNSSKDLIVGNPELLNSPEDPSIIGPQFNIDEGYGNYWDDNHTFAHHSGTPDYIDFSVLKVNTEEDNGYKPRNIEAAESPDGSIKWFDNQTIYTNAACLGHNLVPDDIDCQWIINRLMKLYSLGNINSCTKAMWEYKYFRKLIDMKNKGLLSDQCIGFLNSQSSNPAFQVANIGSAIDKIKYINVDSLERAGQSSESYYNTIDSFRLVISRTILLDSCLKVLNTVNVIRLNQLERDTLSQSDITILCPIADSCPNEMGLGVFFARGLLSIFEERTYPAYSECASQGIIPRSEKISSAYSENLQIFPNPASESVNILLDLQNKETGKLIIMDMQGIEKYNVNIDEFNETHTMDTRSFQNGIYIIKYRSDAGDDQIEKLVITK